MPKHAAPKHVRTRRLMRGGAVTVGAAAAGLSILTVPANAAEHNWTGVAQCESGGNWSINTGNGFSGGLQFTPSTWRAYGGSAYAAQAYQASAAEQIAVAENVLKGQGVGAWPVCGKFLSSNGPTRVANESAGTASRSTRTESAAPKAAAKAAPAPKATPAKKATPAPKAAPAAPARKAPAAAKATAPKAAAAPVHEAPATAPSHKGKAYVVKPGDTLVKIAEAQGLDSWRDVWNKNRSSIHDPNRIYVGQVVYL